MPMPPDEKKLKTIAQAAAELGLPAYILRYWETKFKHIQPFKSAGGHRYYSEKAVQSLREIHHLLYEKNFTIKGAQQYLNEQTSQKAKQAMDAETVKVAETGTNRDKLPGDMLEKLDDLMNQLKAIQDEIADF